MLTAKQKEQFDRDAFEHRAEGHITVDTQDAGTIPLHELESGNTVLGMTIHSKHGTFVLDAEDMAYLKQKNACTQCLENCDNAGQWEPHLTNRWFSLPVPNGAIIFRGYAEYHGRSISEFKHFKFVDTQTFRKLKELRQQHAATMDSSSGAVAAAQAKGSNAEDAASDIFGDMDKAFECIYESEKLIEQKGKPLANAELPYLRRMIFNVPELSEQRGRQLAQDMGMNY